MDTTGTTTTEATEADRPRGRGCGCWITVLVILILGGAISAYFMGTIVLREEKPLPGEAEITDLGLRYVAVPPDYIDARRPVSYTISVAAPKGQQLFQVECAVCHGNAARGDGPLGVTMYPPAADLTSDRTQTKSDGQLYWIIAHGINLTGMPAWGKDYGGGNSDDEIWDMVTYIRSLRGAK